MATTQEIFDAAVYVRDNRHRIDQMYVRNAELVASEIIEWYGAILEESEITIEESQERVGKILSMGQEIEELRARIMLIEAKCEHEFHTDFIGDDSFEKCCKCGMIDE